MRSLFHLACLGLLLISIIDGLGRVEPAEINPLDLNLPDACEAVTQGEDIEAERGSNQNSISLQEVPQSHLPWLNFSRGEFLIGAKHVSGSFSRSVQFSTGAMTLSRTAYNYVYLVEGTLTFSVNNSMDMIIKVQGALSVKTREFCARGCAAQGPTPAWFLYFVTGANSGSLPRKSTMVVPEHDCGILVKLRYPRARTSRTSLITGEVKSLRASDDDLHFPTLDIAALCEGDFEYTRMEEVRNLAEFSGRGVQNLQSDDRSEHSTICESFEDGDSLPIVWNSTCEIDCSPFDRKYSKINHVRSLKVQGFDCSLDGKLSGHLVFTADDQIVFPGINTHLILVTEGIWDFKKEQFLMLACVLDGGDCKIQVSLEVSDIFRTITHPMALFGHVQSLRDRNDPLYFKSFSFFGGGWLSVLSSQNSQDRLQLMQKFTRAPSLEGLIGPLCDQKQFTVKNWAKYPDGSDFSDMDLETLVANPNASSTNSTMPVFLTAMELGSLRREWSYAQARGFPVDDQQTKGRLNVSFIVYVPGMSKMFYESREQWLNKMVAEGWFDRRTGRLCMLGCRSKIWAADGYDDDDTDGMDCSVLFNIRYPETNPSIWDEVPHASGSITSLRSELDPLGFKSINLDSYLRLYRSQARQNFWRKRVDIVMSVGTLCLLIVVLLPQLICTKEQYKHQNFSFHSLILMSALVSGHSVSLFFGINIIILKSSYSGTRSDASPTTPPDAVEMFTTVASMAALLLELRWWLLCRKACAYSEIHKRESPRIIEHHIWYYLGIFGLAFTVVQLTFLSGQQILASRYEESKYRRNHLQQMMWANLQASADVISYFFLLPEVLSRVLWDNKTRAAPKTMYYYYYIYTVLSLVRSLAQFYTVDLIFGPQLQYIG